MKKNIHPDYHTITVVMTDGETYQTRSTWGKEGDVLKLDVDPKTHGAWSDGQNMTLRKTGQAEKFANRYAFLGNSGFAAAPAAAESKDAEAAEPAPKKAAK